MNSMFKYCENIEKLDLSSFNTSNVTDMVEMFMYCYKLKDLKVTNFDTSNVTLMSSMFYDCISLKELDLSSFDTRNVEDNDYDLDLMFAYCPDSLVVYISNKFDTSKAKETKVTFKTK